MVQKARGFNRPACAKSPSTGALFSEQTADRKQLIFTAFDPAKGPTHELARFKLTHALAIPMIIFGTFLPMVLSSQSFNAPARSIHLLHLSRSSAETMAKEITVKGWNNLQSINWAADGTGLFVSSTTNTGASVLRVDLAGNAHVLWEQKGNIGPGVAPCSAPWALPSPDGRHLAIYEWNISSNMWLLENF